MEKNVFDQPVKSNMRTCDNIQKIATVQGDDYTTCCLLDYNYFNNYYKIIALDLSKQLALALALEQALDADPKAIQQVNFTENLGRAASATMFFIIEEAKKKKVILDFSQGTVKVL